MATQISELFKQKKFPKWFQNHSIFKEETVINKVFPKIGLPNCVGEYSIIDNKKTTTTKYAKALLGEIALEMQCVINLVNNGNPDNFIAAKNNKKQISPEVEKFKSLLNIIRTKISKSKTQFLKIEEKTVSIVLPEDVFMEGLKKPIFRKGESFFKVYGKLREMFAKINKVQAKDYLYELEGYKNFNDFSTTNVNGNKLKIIFSADGVDGAWDIATMSMRGITSCQTWGGDYDHCLIGSVLDPFVGIIYLTSGGDYKGYGSKMVRRCIVRFVIDAETRSPYLILDRMYPSEDKDILSVFSSFLKEKTGNKFEIVHNINSKKIVNSYIPFTPLRKKLRNTRFSGKTQAYDDLESLQSYQDTKIKNQDTKDKSFALFEKNSAKKERKFTKNLVEAMQKIAKDNTKKVISNKYNAYVNVARFLSDKIINSVSKEEFANSNTYIQRVYYRYFNRSEILKANSAQLLREFNKSFDKNSRLRGKDFLPIVLDLLKQTDPIMKEKLLEVNQKRKEQFSGELPLP